MRKNMKYKYTPKRPSAAEWLLSRKNLVGYAIVVAMRVIRLKELVRTDQKNVSVSAMNETQLKARATKFKNHIKTECEETYVRGNRKLKEGIDVRKRLLATASRR
jgi:hypothetical protein